VKRIVFVCSGNICRSPMAAAITNNKLKSRQEPAAIISCGTLNIMHRPAAKEAIQAMAEHDIDIESHRSQGVSVGLLRMADFVVVMAPKHERFILESAPELAPKIVRIWEYAQAPLDEIADPVNQDLPAFRACRDLLEESIDSWLNSII